MDKGYIISTDGEFCLLSSDGSKYSIVTQEDIQNMLLLKVGVWYEDFEREFNICKKMVRGDTVHLDGHRKLICGYSGISETCDSGYNGILKVCPMTGSTEITTGSGLKEIYAGFFNEKNIRIYQDKTEKCFLYLRSFKELHIDADDGIVVVSLHNILNAVLSGGRASFRCLVEIEELNNEIMPSIDELFQATRYVSVSVSRLHVCKHSVDVKYLFSLCDVLHTSISVLDNVQHLDCCENFLSYLYECMESEKDVEYNDLEFYFHFNFSCTIYNT